jgi:signal transduction histidine kinase
MKIKTKFLLILILISFCLITIISSVLYYNAKKTIITSAMENLDSIASIEKSRIVESINNNLDKIKLIKNRYGIQLNMANYLKEPQKKYLDNINKNLSIVFPSSIQFENISIITAKGIVLASTENLWVGRDFSAEDAFQRGLKEDSVDNFFIDKNGKPSVYFSGPIINENEKVGVIIVESDPNRLFQINNNYTGLGETGEVGAAKIDKDGDLITISNLRFMPDSFLKLKIPRNATERPIIHAINKEEKIFTDKINYRGKKVLTATRYIPETNWAFTVNVDQDEVFAPIYDFQKLLIILVVITSIFVIILSVYISEQITRPVSEITGIAQKISKGNLSEKVQVNSNDEIGLLADAFNEMTENLIRTNQDLKEEILLRRSAEAEMEKFTYVSSHDLQEPLRTVVSFTQLLEKKYKDKLDHEANEYIELIIKASMKMKNLINDLLTYSKLGYEKKDFNDIDLNKIIDYVKNNFNQTNPENSLNIINSELPTIMANYLLMIELFQNIISNSIKFSSNKPEIIISAKKENNEWLFAIADNGIGINKYYHGKIFEPFQQLSKKYEGTGLGLTICKKIVELHQGRIWLESEEGKGTTFFFTIPV